MTEQVNNTEDSIKPTKKKTTKKAVVSTSVKPDIRRAIDAEVEMGKYVNRSEFIRVAILEKLGLEK